MIASRFPPAGDGRAGEPRTGSDDRLQPGPKTTSSDRCFDDPATVYARAAAALCRQRLRRPHLRNRLVPAATARDWLVGGVAGSPPRHVHGRYVSRQLPAPSVHFGARAPAAGVCVLRDRHRRARPADPLRRAAVCERLHGLGRIRPGGSRLSRHRGQHLPPPADDSDGCDAAGDVALGRDQPARRRLARLLLRRQHRRRGDREPARRLLSAPRLRHGDGDLRRRGAQPSRRRTGSPHRWRDAVRGRRRRAGQGQAGGRFVGRLHRDRALRV